MGAVPIGPACGNRQKVPLHDDRGTQRLEATVYHLLANGPVDNIYITFRACNN